MSVADRVVIFEDDAWRRFAPLSWSRPVWDLRCGITTLAEKILRLFPLAETGIACREAVAPFARVSAAAVVDLSFDDDRLLFVNGRVLADPGFALHVSFDSPEGFYQCPVGIAALRLDGGRASRLSQILSNLHDSSSWTELFEEDLPTRDMDVPMASGLWDLVSWTPEEIEHEADRLDEDDESPYANELVSHGVSVLGDRPILIHPDAEVDPGVVLDAREGAIVLDSGVRVQPFTYIEGPCWVGRDSILTGGRIRGGCSIGPMCRVGGEVENCVLQGYSNKYHEGFLGHSYAGEWVNLGALTTNSDLKNTYGEIKVWSGGDIVATGSNKVGCFIGDHVKTGIGTLLTTGLVVGFSANVFGGGITGGRFVPDFGWGGKGGWTEHRLKDAIRTARIAMSRRGVEFTDEHRALFEHVFSESADWRESWFADERKKSSRMKA
jgi:UDP-N-acetylglucosamine diphosphorylase/glucosamine-1-phosphate N-acetyltransferase